MSLIRRRKSPGWGKTNIELGGVRSVRRVKKISKVTKVVKKTKVIKGIKVVKKTTRKPVKIVNPTSMRKITLNGPTHKRLIKDGILDSLGKDIRSKPTRPRPKHTRLYGDVMGNIMKFMPEKTMVKISKVTKDPEQSLLSYPFDLSDRERCQAFSDLDFDSLMKNQNLDRRNLFKCVVRRGLLDKVKILLKDSKINPSDGDNTAIVLASGYGRIEVVKELLKDSRVDPGANNNKAIRDAIYNSFVRGDISNRHLAVVKELLKDKRVDPTIDNNMIIKWASEEGYLDIVKELLKDERVDPGDDHNMAIRNASFGKHLRVVRELLKDPRVDPSDDDNRAIQVARDIRIKKLLARDPRVKNTYYFSSNWA